MNNFTLTVSQSGGEYYGQIKVKANVIEQINHNTIKVDGVEMVFDHEHISSITKD